MTLALRSGFTMLYRLEVITEKRQYLIEFVHADRLLALLDFSDKAQPDAATPGQLLLGQSCLGAQFFQAHCYTRKGILSFIFHCNYTLSGIVITCKIMFYTRKGTDLRHKRLGYT